MFASIARAIFGSSNDRSLKAYQRRVPEINALEPAMAALSDAALRAKLEQHLSDCPNCWVICDTTKKTIRVYKGMDPCNIPAEVHSRLMIALEKKISKKGS